MKDAERKELKDFIIAVDFDETLMFTDYDNWPTVKSANTDIINAVNKLYQEGFIIAIWTCRSTELDVKVAKAALKKYDVMYDLFNENAKYRIDAFSNDSRKISADKYVDDKSVGGLCTGQELIDDVYKTYERHLTTHSRIYTPYL